MTGAKVRLFLGCTNLVASFEQVIIFAQNFEQEMNKRKAALTHIRNKHAVGFFGPPNYSSTPDNRINRSIFQANRTICHTPPEVRKVATGRVHVLLR